MRSPNLVRFTSWGRVRNKPLCYVNLPSCYALFALVREQLKALNYTDYTYSVPKGGFGYASAVKTVDRSTASR